MAVVVVVILLELDRLAYFIVLMLTLFFYCVLRDKGRTKFYVQEWLISFPEITSNFFLLPNFIEQKKNSTEKMWST
jgi:hypothetical protein